MYLSLEANDKINVQSSQPDSNMIQIWHNRLAVLVNFLFIIMMVPRLNVNLVYYSEHSCSNHSAFVCSVF